MDKYRFVIKNLDKDVADSIMLKFKEVFPVFNVEVVKEGDVYKMDKLEK